MDEIDDLLGPSPAASALDAPMPVTLFADHMARTKRDEVASIRDLAQRIDEIVADIKADLPWIKLALFGDLKTAKGRCATTKICCPCPVSRETMTTAM